MGVISSMVNPSCSSVAFILGLLGSNSMWNRSFGSLSILMGLFLRLLRMILQPSAVLVIFCKYLFYFSKSFISVINNSILEFRHIAVKMRNMGLI